MHQNLRSASYEKGGLRAIGLALAIAFAAAGTSPAPAQAPERLVIAQPREPSSLNPALENGLASMEWSVLLFQSLVKFDDRGKLVGDAALEVPTLANGGIAKDGLTVTYHLRPGLRFADGSPLTARDCVYSVKAILNPRNNVQATTGYDQVVKAEARGAGTFVLHLRRPYAPILVTVMAPSGYPILPAHILGRYPDFNRIPFDTAPVGSGPYVVERWARGDRVVMHANPYYAGGKPAFDRLEIRFVPDGGTVLNLLRTHEIDGAFNIPYPLVSQAREITGTRVVMTPSNSAGSLLFNTTDPLANNADLRHALAGGIDFRSAVEKSFQGVVDARDAAAGVFQWAYDPRAFPPISFDPKEARRRLEAAGWKPGPDGILVKGDRRAEGTLALVSGNIGDTVFANLIASYERDLGIDISVKSYAPSQYYAPAAQGGPIYAGKFTMAIWPYIDGDDPDASDQFTCANLPPKGYNKTRICDRQIDTLLAAGVATFDVRRRKDIYTRLQRRLAVLLPLVFTYNRTVASVLPARLQNATGSVSTIWWNVAAWRLITP